jgi:hypothetical protein
MNMIQSWALIVSSLWGMTFEDPRDCEFMMYKLDRLCRPIATTTAKSFVSGAYFPALLLGRDGCGGSFSLSGFCCSPGEDAEVTEQQCRVKCLVLRVEPWTQPVETAPFVQRLIST